MSNHRRKQLKYFSSWLLLATLTQPAISYAQDCGFAFLFNRPDEQGTKIVRVYEGDSEPKIGNRRPLAFIVPDVKVNTDGTRVSYNVNDPQGATKAINNIRNAYRNHHKPVSDFEKIRDANWLPRSQVWTVLSDKIIERDARLGRENLPCMDAGGYLISMTADVAVDGGWNRVGDCDQSKWIDAATIPTLVLPGNSQFRGKGARLRSVVVSMTLHEPRRIALGIVGDSGPENELGEASIELNRILNGLPAGTIPANRTDAKRRFQGPESVIMILPGSNNQMPRPVTPDRVQAFAEEKFEAWGGKDRLEGCLNELGYQN